MPKKINVAIVGCGYWGPNLIRNFHNLSECSVKVVCDKDTERLAHIKRQYPDIEVNTNFNRIINDNIIDAVVIATPPSSHFDLARQALCFGKHTFIEKPMATSVRECLELVAISQQRKLTLMVGHTFIYSIPIRTIKSIIDSGDIGEILYISSSRLNLGLFQNSINVTWDLAPHDISIIQYLWAAAPVSLNCQGKAHLRPGIEDVTTLSLQFQNNGYAVFHYSWLDPNKVREMKIVGTKKMIFYDDNQPLEKIKVYDKRVETPPYYDTFAEFQYSYHYGDMYCPYLKQVEPLKVEAQHFLDCIRTGEIPLSSGIDGLRVVQILEASSESLKKNGANVQIDSLKIDKQQEKKMPMVDHGRQQHLHHQEQKPDDGIQFVDSGLIIL